MSEKYPGPLMNRVSVESVAVCIIVIYEVFYVHAWYYQVGGQKPAAGYWV